MAKLICSNAIDGAIKWVARAESMLIEVIKENGESFSPEEISLIKELVQKHSLPQILIRIEPIAKLHVF